MLLFALSFFWVDILFPFLQFVNVSFQSKPECFSCSENQSSLFRGKSLVGIKTFLFRSLFQKVCGMINERQVCRGIVTLRP